MTCYHELIDLLLIGAIIFCTTKKLVVRPAALLARTNNLECQTLLCICSPLLFQHATMKAWSIPL